MNNLGLRGNIFHFSSYLRSVYINFSIRLYRVNGCSFRYDMRSSGLTQHTHLVGKVKLGFYLLRSFLGRVDHNCCSLI